MCQVATIHPSPAGPQIAWQIQGQYHSNTRVPECNSINTNHKPTWIQLLCVNSYGLEVSHSGWSLKEDRCQRDLPPGRASRRTCGVHSIYKAL
jgi:hypothetical protein